MEKVKYHRYLSKIDVWTLSLGCVIGWGAFVMPGTTFLPVAGPAGTVIAMLISAAIMLVIGAKSMCCRQRTTPSTWRSRKCFWSRPACASIPLKTGRYVWEKICEGVEVL